MDVMVFTPVYRLEPETVKALLALEWDGPLTLVLQRDNPHVGDDKATGVKNHLHQYQRGRETFLRGDYDAMLVIESDIIPPPDTLKRLAALDADIAYGVYVFRSERPVVNVFRAYSRPSRNPGSSLSVVDQMWPQALKRGVVPCSGGGLGCILIKRHVLEVTPFRMHEYGAYCDSAFTEDVWRAEYDMRADTGVICGHKDTDGRVLWPEGTGHNAP